MEPENTPQYSPEELAEKLRSWITKLYFETAGVGDIRVIESQVRDELRNPRYTADVLRIFLRKPLTRVKRTILLHHIHELNNIEVVDEKPSKKANRDYEIIRDAVIGRIEELRTEAINQSDATELGNDYPGKRPIWNGTREELLLLLKHLHFNGWISLHQNGRQSENLKNAKNKDDAFTLSTDIRNTARWVAGVFEFKDDKGTTPRNFEELSRTHFAQTTKLPEVWDTLSAWQKKKTRF